jgi:hypothetical protein
LSWGEKVGKKEVSQQILTDLTHRLMRESVRHLIRVRIAGTCWQARSVGATSISNI